MRIIPSNVLSSSDLVIDAVYEGGRQGNAADDPISKILEGVGNQGGFRAAGRGPDKKYVVLYTSGEVDLTTGQFIYFGDNKTPGHQLHETTRGGNEILRRAFEFLHASPPMRAMVPPLSSRDTQLPLAAGPCSSKDWRSLGSLACRQQPTVAVWKTTEGQRFQNYRAIFTVLDAPVIAHEAASMEVATQSVAISSAFRTIRSTRNFRSKRNVINRGSTKLRRILLEFEKFRV